MKKFLSCLLAFALVVSLSAVAFAYDKGTSIVSVFDANNTEVTDKLSLVSFDDRKSLDDAAKAAFEAANDTITGAKDATDLNKTLNNRIAAGSIGASDLFDHSASEEVAFPLTVNVKYGNMKHFVALLHFVNGSWNWVPVERLDDGFSFKADSLSPFVIIVSPAVETSKKTVQGEGTFVGSVYNPGAPVVTTVEEEGEPAVVVTPYSEASSLPQNLHDQVEAAYKAVAEEADLTSLNEKLKEAAGDNEIAASDVFVLSTQSSFNSPVKVVLKDETVDNFIGVLCYNNGTWEWVEAEVNGSELSFSIEKEAPYVLFAAVK